MKDKEILNIVEKVKEKLDQDSGSFIEEKCPRCGSYILKNRKGDRWCSFISCGWNLFSKKGFSSMSKEKRIAISSKGGKAPHSKYKRKIMEKWSRKFDKCQKCGTIDIPHSSKGLCNRCYEKSPYQFAKRSAYQKSPVRQKYYKERRELLSEKERYASWQLKKKYGITLEEKKNLYIQQNGLCALCFKTLGKTLGRCMTDHDHQTGKIRGLLHPFCNSALTYIEDKIFYNQAIVYFKKNEI